MRGNNVVDGNSEGKINEGDPSIYLYIFFNVCDF